MVSSSSDSIAGNIAPGKEYLDKELLRHAAEVANIHNFIEALPLGYNTKIGLEGHGLSQGQKQRILIARAVYKNPEFIFFDEATMRWMRTMTGPSWKISNNSLKEKHL